MEEGQSRVWIPQVGSGIVPALLAVPGDLVKMDPAVIADGFIVAISVGIEEVEQGRQGVGLCGPLMGGGAPALPRPP